jgi:hypothetical protein
MKQGVFGAPSAGEVLWRPPIKLFAVIFLFIALAKSAAN